MWLPNEAFFEKQNLIGIFNSQILLKQPHGLQLGGVKKH